MDYKTMMTSALKEECKKRGLPVSARMVSPKTGKEHCNWLPREALIASLERSDAGLIEVKKPTKVDASKLLADAPMEIKIPDTIPDTHSSIFDTSKLPDELKAVWETITKMKMMRLESELKEKGLIGTVPEEAKTEPKTEAKETKKSTSGGSGGRKHATADEVAAVKRTTKLLSEFQFTPQLRFITSLANAKSIDEGKEYIVNYFRLTNNPYSNDVAEKLKSIEGTSTVESMVKADFGMVNRRLEIFFGAPGSGKTTKAMELYPEAEVVVCHAGTTPDELFRGFTFEDGKPVFKGCALGRAMSEGKPVILDEINLLSRECLRALQAVTDGKETATIGTDTFPIKDGFKVIATMNLSVDGQVEGLPTPLVDRASVIKEFEMPVETLCEIAKNLPR